MFVGTRVIYNVYFGTRVIIIYYDVIIVFLPCHIHVLIHVLTITSIML